MATDSPATPEKVHSYKPLREGRCIEVSVNEDGEVWLHETSSGAIMRIKSIGGVGLRVAHHGGKVDVVPWEEF